jgi:hypothetical protein
MNNPSGRNIFKEFFGSAVASALAGAVTANTLRAMRRLCDEAGHPGYRVHGRKSPVKVECPRCKCTWAIGPKTEPPA